MSATRILAVAAFLLAALLFVFVEWLARRDGSKITRSRIPPVNIPTLGEVNAFIMRYRVGRVPVGRIAMFGFWWWLGWHFFAR